MLVIYSALIFVILIVILSALRTRLVFELSGTSLLLFGTPRPGIIFYSILVLPGTVIHELSHWLIAEILQVRTGEIVILPELASEGKEERLGSVQTERTDPLRGFLIGIAPFLTGLLILVTLGRLFSIGWFEHWAWWQLTLIVYGIVVMGDSMLISLRPSDSFGPQHACPGRRRHQPTCHSSVRGACLTVLWRAGAEEAREKAVVGGQQGGIRDQGERGHIFRENGVTSLGRTGSHL